MSTTPATPANAADRPNDTDLLTAGQAADYLGLDRRRMWELVKREQLPTYEVPLKGYTKLYRRAHLDALKRPRERQR